MKLYIKKGVHEYEPITLREVCRQAFEDLDFLGLSHEHIAAEGRLDDWTAKEFCQWNPDSVSVWYLQEMLETIELALIQRKAYERRCENM